MNFELTKSIARYFKAFKNIPLLPIVLDEQIKVFTLFFRPFVFSKMTDFVQEVKSWEGVRSHYHRYGGLEFRVNGREFCHLHGDGLLDTLLDKKSRRYWIDKGLVETHHVEEQSNWVSCPFKGDSDLKEIFEMVQGAYSLKRGIPAVK